jgi:hypothetical protein
MVFKVTDLAATSLTTRKAGRPCALPTLRCKKPQSQCTRPSRARRCCKKSCAKTTGSPSTCAKPSNICKTSESALLAVATLVAEVQALVTRGNG